MEEWRSYFIHGFEYEINRDGVIRRAMTKRILQPHLNPDGYPVVTMGPANRRTQRRVHKLVAEAWIPNPNNYQEVDHIDFDRTNCKVDNLQWINHKENIHRSHAVGHYRGMKGSKNPNALVDEATVILMRQDYANGMTRYAIGKKYGVSWTQTDRICKGENWHNV